MNSMYNAYKMHVQIVDSCKKIHMKWKILMFQHQLCGIDLTMRYIKKRMEKIKKKEINFPYGEFMDRFRTIIYPHI